MYVSAPNAHLLALITARRPFQQESWPKVRSGRHSRLVVPGLDSVTRSRADPFGHPLEPSPAAGVVEDLVDGGRELVQVEGEPLLDLHHVFDHRALALARLGLAAGGAELPEPFSGTLSFFGFVGGGGIGAGGGRKGRATVGDGVARSRPAPPVPGPPRTAARSPRSPRPPRRSRPPRTGHGGSRPSQNELKVIIREEIIHTVTVGVLLALSGESRA